MHAVQLGAPSTAARNHLHLTTTALSVGTGLPWFSQLLLRNSFASQRLRTFLRTVLLQTALDEAFLVRLLLLLGIAVANLARPLVAVLRFGRLLYARKFCSENDVGKVDYTLLGVGVDHFSSTTEIIIAIRFITAPKFDKVGISQLSAVEELLDFDSSSLQLRLLGLSRGVRPLESSCDPVQWASKDWCFSWLTAADESTSELSAIVADRWRGSRGVVQCVLRRLGIFAFLHVRLPLFNRDGEI